MTLLPQVPKDGHHIPAEYYNTKLQHIFQPIRAVPLVLKVFTRADMMLITILPPEASRKIEQKQKPLSHALKQKMLQKTKGVRDFFFWGW